jgi:hypothetical protein
MRFVSLGSMLIGSFLCVSASAQQIVRVFQLDRAVFAATEMAAELDPQAAARALVARTGAGSGSDGEPSIFYNDRTGALHVRGTPDQLKAIEQFLSKTGSGAAARSVLIKVTIAEVPDSKAPQVEKLMRPVQPGQSSLAVEMKEENQHPRPGPKFYSQVLTERQFAEVMQALEQVEGVDVLTVPVQTSSGSEVKIDLETLETRPNAISTEGGK